MSRARAGGKLDGLFIVLAMSLAFMAFSFIRVFGDAGSARLGRGVLEAVLGQPIWGTQLGTELIQFVAALVLLHGLVAIAAWAMARLSLVAWPDSGNSQRVLSVFWLVLFIVWILAANAYWFSKTSLGGPWDHIAKMNVAGFSAFSILSLVLGAAILTTLLTVVVRRIGQFLRMRVVWVGGAACLSAGVAFPAFSVLGSGSRDVQLDPPHVVLIGVDSLRTDYVQNEERIWTPAIDGFLDQSVSFSDAYTPLARTFPAWVSIVSGRHPHTTGAFVNLLPRELIDEGQTLPSVLGASGYETVYAIDEVRFSNLDESYGFDRMLAPAMGAADFLLGFFADSPLANITANTVVGKWLFPYTHANRAAANTYNPDSFINRIDSAVDFNQPTMLAVHFTLAHWPYTWADSPRLDPLPSGEPREPEEVARARYENAVGRVDQQFEQLVALLEKKGALENAIVVVLSDHGESLGEPSPIADDDPETSQPLAGSSMFGHGTHVLSKDQYNVVLGLRSYGNELIPAEPGTILTNRVTLEDVTPTILDALDLDQGLSFDGRSLLPQIGGDSTVSVVDGSRIRFLETEFNPPGLSFDGLASVSAATTAADKYRIDPSTDRVLVRTEFVDEILASRQYAAELDGRILVTVPAKGNFREQYMLHLDPAMNEPLWLDRPPTATEDPEIYRLWQALEQRFVQVRERPIRLPPDLNVSNL